MPELPEAETIGRVLKRALVGRKITEVHVFSPAMREPLTPLLDAELPGRRFVDVRRRARYVIAELDDGRALLMHSACPVWSASNRPMCRNASMNVCAQRAPW